MGAASSLKRRAADAVAVAAGASSLFELAWPSSCPAESSAASQFVPAATRRRQRLLAAIALGSVAPAAFHTAWSRWTATL